MQKTALDLMARGYDVHMVADAVSSSTMVERLFSLEVSVMTITLHIKRIFNHITTCIITLSGRYCRVIPLYCPLTITPLCQVV